MLVYIRFHKLQSPLRIAIDVVRLIYILTEKFACKFFWIMIIRVLHRFDIIGLGPDSPEDEEGIKASSEICKFWGGFSRVKVLVSEILK